DNTLRLWDREGNPIGEPFQGHSRSVNAVAFSPDGEHIVSGSNDNTLRLWDREGNPIGEPFQGHSRPVRTVAFYIDGEHIVSGSNDNTLRLWDREGNPIGRPFQGHSNSVLAVTFNPEGDLLVSGSSDRTLQLWDRIRWQDWLHDCCNKLLHHSDLVQPKTDVAKRACQVCMDHAWTRSERAEFLVAQGKALAYYQQDVAAAVAKFEAALELDGAALEAEPRGLAEQIKGWGTSP
ncbi:MAG: hypothetical protein AAF572_26800, partial [Cyanobacteria bacterium P01_B01_bin.77]